MGCICSKGTCACSAPHESENVKQSNKPSSASGVVPKRDGVLADVVGGRTDASVRQHHKVAAQVNLSSTGAPADMENNKTERVETPKRTHHQRRATVDVGEKIGLSPMSRIVSIPNGAEGEQVVAGWPSWLSSVAGEAIKGWVPRRADSFEKLNKIGQGTYSSVYKAKDLETGKIVAMKKVRFANMDPESVRFMAREIYILRKLDHPNVMKLEGLVASRMSGSLYLVFEYMDHDLSGLVASRGIKFSEPQIKCYMQQLFCGLEHCHNRDILHRDIKGSNLLINNDGVLKIGDFGLATLMRPDQSQPLTSRVVTLWYRAPELLLGATQYGVSVDLWSAGCILAELFAGKPIMPGRTEVEQMHKIFKLCGSPSEEYWRKSKLPHATSFKPQHPYRRCLAETFKDFPPSALSLVDRLLAIEPEDRGSVALGLKSEFFRTKPLPCNPSSLPKYPPSKEFDARVRDEAKRKKPEAVMGRGAESVRRGSRGSKEAPTPEFNGPRQVQRNLRGSHAVGSSYDLPGKVPKGIGHNGLYHSASMVHPNGVQPSWTKNMKEDEAGRSSSVSNAELRPRKSYPPSQGASKLPSSSQRNDDIMFGKDSGMDGYVGKKSRIHKSGPLVPPGGNIDDMLKEHERQIQEAVRKARHNKGRAKEGYDEFGEYELLHHHMGNAG